MKIRTTARLGASLVVLALVLGWAVAYAASGSDAAPTLQDQQATIDQLTQQLQQARRHEAELEIKLRMAESKKPVPAPTPAPPLSSPAITGPLQAAGPTEIDTYFPVISDLAKAIPGTAGLGNLQFNGVLSGVGIVQDHAMDAGGDRTVRADITNAQLIFQKADGPIQFYLQAGAYDIPALGAPLVPTGKALNDLYGPLPIAFITIAPTDNFSIMAGNLPTLIGAEYTFTFENMNVERGLLWAQENAVNRGVQLNYSRGPLSASISWNNGFYSNSYTWLTGALSYTLNSANSIVAAGGQNLGFSKFTNFATPLLLNNGGIYDLAYTYNSAPWIVQPYFQWSWVPHNTEIGADKTTSTFGGAILASYAFTDNLFLAGRVEYIGTTGSTSDGSVNMLYGPGSEAWSITLTPTYQYKKFFVRPEVSFVQAMSYTSGDVFGSAGENPAQFRALIETGILF